MFLNPLMLAGLTAVSIPIIIHLLNQRRYRVVKWAAMDFLRQALQQNRGILQLRDILLLTLRTAAILLFGFALARPTSPNRAEQNAFPSMSVDANRCA